jgi:hypothetical protein
MICTNYAIQVGGSEQQAAGSEGTGKERIGADGKGGTRFHIIVVMQKKHAGPRTGAARWPALARLYAQAMEVVSRLNYTTL